MEIERADLGGEARQSAVSAEPVSYAFSAFEGIGKPLTALITALSLPNVVYKTSNSIIIFELRVLILALLVSLLISGFTCSISGPNRLLMCKLLKLNLEVCSVCSRLFHI